MTRDELIEKITAALVRDVSIFMHPDEIDRDGKLDALVQSQWRVMRENAVMCLTAIEAAGCTVVPNDPTKEMIKEGQQLTQCTGDEVMPDQVYERMIAASPFREKE